MILHLSKRARTALAKTFRELLDGGEGPATVEVRSGKLPDGADAAAGGLLLGILTCSEPCADDPTDGTLRLSEIEEEKRARASGQASWARFKDGDGDTVFDCDVSGQHGGAMLELNTTAVVERGPLRIDEFLIEILGSGS